MALTIGRVRSPNLGHDVRLIPPAYVKPFVKRGKTDAAACGSHQRGG